jgi:hypothetical protein
MTKFQFDISYDFFSDAGCHAWSDGQDVTTLFENDISHPLVATIIEAAGPGGGNPVVEFEFLDVNHARSWAFDNGIIEDVEEFWLGQV